MRREERRENRNGGREERREERNGGRGVGEKEQHKDELKNMLTSGGELEYSPAVFSDGPQTQIF